MTQPRFFCALSAAWLLVSCGNDAPSNETGLPADGVGGGSDPSASGGTDPVGAGGGVFTGGSSASGGTGTGGNSSPAATGGRSSGGAPSGGASATGGGSSSGGTSPAGTGGEGDVGGTPRTECPDAPPATQKDVASDRSLAVSKEDYAQLLSKEAPFVGSRGELPFHLYAPDQASEDESARLPLLVVLHGGYGREVTDGNILVDVAQYLLGSQNGLLTEANRAAFPTFILLPHCRVDEGCNFGSNEWSSAGGAHFQIGEEPSVAGGTALELIEHVIATRSVDPSRVYLTGNSMGGGGTWEFASRRPDLFAAVLPVSGHPPAEQFLAPIAEAKLPVWAFGGENDSTNPYADTVSAVAAIDSAGGCAWLTTYNGTGHDDGLWSSPYLEPDIWSWLFAQDNPSAPQ